MRHSWFVAGLLSWPLIGCGAVERLAPQKAKTTNAAGSSGDATGNDITRLEVLAPGELARKIYDAFGPNMTMVQENGKSLDYLEANAANFIGSISNDPNNKYASSFSIGYFLALAGLSSVVGQNYTVSIYSNTAAHDCRNESGAEGLLRAVAPTMTDADAKRLAADLQQACNADPASAASAIVQSYSTALKSTL